MNKETLLKEQIANQGRASWYVVNTNIHSERLAKLNLERNGVEVYLPVRFAAKKAKSAVTPFFPGYLFVCPDPVSPRWNAVYTSVGVRSVLGSAGKPSPAPHRLMDALRRHEVDGVIQTARKPSKALPFKPGDKVRVKAGPFVDFDGVFDRGERFRVMVLLSLFGGQTPVEFNAADLELAN